MKAPLSLSLAAAAALLSSSALAADVDLQRSQFKWTGSKSVGGSHNGRIFLKSGHLALAKGQITGGALVMDMASFTVDDLEGKWAEKLKTHLKSEDFFEVTRFPTAQLKISGQKDADTVQGTLTIKGEARPVEIDFERNAAGAYTGTLRFDRTRFGLTYGSKSFFKSLLADRVIADEVRLDFELVLTSTTDRN